MYKERCKVLSNEKVAPGHFVIQMASPRISKKALPGQFVQVLCEDSYEPLLPRPFSFLTAGKNEFAFLYHTVGKGTNILSKKKKGDTLSVLGPLGNGFGFSQGEKSREVILVGGGVGIPPLYHLAEFLSKKMKPGTIHVYLGARNKSLLLCEKEFKKLKVDLNVATDDGSKGRKGLVTLLLEEKLYGSDPTQSRVYTCGPTPMLKAVSAIAGKYQVPCEVSVEVPMACGFGACLGCAIKVKGAEAGHRFAIACCEGPVFCGDQILWE